jgi:hypothetical protein
MNRIRWWIMGAICLLLSLVPMATAGQVWASVSPQSNAVSAHMQGGQAAVRLLLDDDMAPPSAQLQVVQVAISLLLTDDELQTEIDKAYLPLISR